MGFLRELRRRRVLARHAIDDALWREVTARMACLRALSEEEDRSLRELSLIFLAEKEFTGARGMVPDDRVRITVAAQACLPVLALGIDWYRGWRGIVIYPDDFRVKRNDVDEAGVVHEWTDELAGEAMPGGPVVLSWNATLHETELNVVIHEFAHKLDMLNGEADGLPPLHAGMDRRAWSKAFGEAYAGFCDALDRGRDTWLDPYGGEHPAEFFAVASEAFFVEPAETRRRYPDVYAQLARFYRQDPAARLAR